MLDVQMVQIIVYTLKISMFFNFMQNVNTIIFICGPTCTGKSSVAINLSKETNGVIINSDAMQVYK